MGAITELIERMSDGIALVECADIDSKGSGFVVSPNGDVVTNAHFVAKTSLVGGYLSVQYSSAIKVRIGGVAHNASLLTDPNEPRPIVYDYALLRLDKSATPVHLDVGDAGIVRSGDDVVCLGYPLDFEAVVATHGMVSAIVRRPSHWNALHMIRTIVTDALIQFGNSGGPMCTSTAGSWSGSARSSIRWRTASRDNCTTGSRTPRLLAFQRWRL